VEIVVATPGRLLDHVQQRTINLSQVEVLVLDEADRMLDMGFIPDVKRIISLLPKQRQGLLFSATFSDEIKKLADAMLNAPVLIEVARRNAVTELVTHIVHPVAREKKRELLVHLIKSRKLNQVLVFCGTRLGTNRLAYQLNHEGVHAAAIHGDKTQSERMQALDEFKNGKVGVLVATDVAARGLDIVELPYVVNFELPSVPEDYVHRIGRTGRAGSTGEAISLVCSEEHERLGAIEKIIKQSIPQSLVPGFEPNASDVPSYSRERGADGGAGRGGRGGSDGRGRSERPSLTRSERPERSGRHERSERPSTAPRPAGKAQDPLFSKPYEPKTAPAAPQAQPDSQPDSPRSTNRPVRQVAALLGGIRKT
jgi:ATP-dependent RNA helicase RhlE